MNTTASVKSSSPMQQIETAAPAPVSGDLTLYMAALELKDLDREIKSKIAKIHARSEQREAYTKQVSQLNELVSQFKDPKANYAHVVGSPRVYEFAEGGKKIGSTMLDNTTPVGYSLVTGTPEREVRLNKNQMDQFKATQDRFLALIGHSDFHPKDDGRLRIEGHGQAAKDRLQKVADAVGAHAQVGQVYNVSRKAIENAVSDLNNKISDIGSKNDIDSLQLQSLMSKRQEAMQFASNILKSRHEQAQVVNSKIA